MPAKERPGQVNVILAPELLDEVRAFADGRGLTLRYVFERALRRHLDNPPPQPLPDPPMPPAAPDPLPSKAARRGRKPGAKTKS